MAFKMRGWNAGEGTGSAIKFKNTMAPNQEMMGARQSPMMTWEGAVGKSEGEINKWVAERKRIKAKYKGTSNPKGYKDDPAYQAVQNKINKAYGADKRHGKTETESKETLDEFAENFAKVLQDDPDKLHSAPISTPVGRVDEVYAARNLCLRHPWEEE